MPFAYTKEFLHAIPKTDLHLHLDGSLRLPTLIELAKERNVKLPSYEPDGLLELVFKKQYKDLPDYLHGFAYTCAVMSDAEALERVACELAQDNLAEGVRYIEVRFAPQLHVREGFDIGQVIAAVDRGLDRARREHEATPAVQERGEPAFRYGIITCAMRDVLARLRPLFRPAPGGARRVARPGGLRGGLALAGPLGDRGPRPAGPADRRLRPRRRRARLPGLGPPGKAFEYAKRHFMKTTVHAGEAYGPESSFQAITRLNADRIGHGTHLFAADQVKVAADPEALRAPALGVHRRPPDHPRGLHHLEHADHAFAREGRRTT